MSHDKDALLPCPFCGGEASWWPHEKYAPQCTTSGCWAMLGAYDSELDAITAWNRRARITAALAEKDEEDWIVVDERLPDEVGQMCRWRSKSGLEVNGFYFARYFYAPGRKYTKDVVQEWQPIRVPPPIIPPLPKGDKQ